MEMTTTAASVAVDMHDPAEAFLAEKRPWMAPLVTLPGHVPERLREVVHPL